MSAQDFLKWMEVVGAKHAADVVSILGINRNTAQEIVAAARSGNDLRIKKTVALAMSATAQGLKPWDEYER